MTTRYIVLTFLIAIHRRLILSALLLWGASGFAQHVETKDAGAGRKLELHYDAAGQVTETDTIGADGKLLEKNVLEKPAGAYVPNTIATSYWPNGQVHKIARNTYDNNANFTGEFIQTFDDSGKQIGGHRLTHDPWTNIYTCSEWNTAANDYKPVECPAGEESSAAPETVKKFAADEVTQQLARARQAAQQSPTNVVNTKPPAATGANSNVKEVGLVLPANLHAGERISGSVVDDPSNYQDVPDVMVTPIALPATASGSAAGLSGWQVEISGQPPQSAAGPIGLTIQPRQTALAVLIRQADGSGAPVSKTIELPQSTRAKTTRAANKTASSYVAPAVCVKNQLCVVEGPFSGDSSKTFAAFQSRPAKIVAETVDAVYLSIPEATGPGPRPLVIAEGAKAIAFPMVVAEFSIRPDRRNLPKGEIQLMYPSIEGPSDLPDPEWQVGNFPPSNLGLARKLVPGFELGGPDAAHAKQEAGEAEEQHENEQHAAMQAGQKSGPEAKSDSGENEGGGELLLVIKNLSPDMAGFRDSKDGMFVFHLHAASFKAGDFRYKFLVEQKQTGDFGLRAWLIPFFAPVIGQEFSDSTTAK
jgi:hypothetical protein